MKSLTLFLLLSLGLCSVSQAQEGSDIWLGEFNLNNNPAITNLVRISNNPAYTNQPYFFDSNHVYFTQAISANDATQMDIFVHRIRENQSENLSDSSESEYSATPLPYANGMSVIRVDDSGKQYLWELSSEGEPVRHLVPAIEPVGYQVWLNNKELLLFVLGEPHTLQRVDISQGDAPGKVLDDNIGASLYRFERSDWFLYTRTDKEQTMLKAYNSKLDKSVEVMPLPQGSQYFSVNPTGHVITSDGQQLQTRQVIAKGSKLTPKDGWEILNIEGPACSSGISRTALSPLGDKIALVCPRI
jgi:hypothetical protein